MAVPGLTDAAQFNGRVTRSSTGLGIDGATVTLDAAPPDGAPEHTETTDSFGFVQIAGVMGGDYELRIVHGGFASHVSSTNLPPSGNLNGTYALTPLGGTRFDLQLVVNDVTTGLNLEAVPVAVDRFNGAADTVAAEVLQTQTDATGNAWLRGVSSGFFRFRFNEAGLAAPPIPKWLPYTTAGQPEDKRFLSATHVAGAQLKPDPQNVTVQVRGLDPVGGAFSTTNAPLANVFLEVTGLDPRDATVTVLPPRSSVSDANGQALFTGLPAVPLQITARKMGYRPASLIVTPDPATGAFPALPVIDLVLQPTHLFVQLQSVYTNQTLYGWARMRLQGLPGTATEGIDRVEAFTWWSPPYPDQRGFFNLLPGRYRLTMDDTAQPFVESQVRPRFQFADYVDVTEGVWTDVTAELAVAPATVRGRLYAADERGSVTQTAGDEDASIYLPRQQTGIELIEYAPDSHLVLTQRVVTVDTDEAGNFSLDLLPGRYGIRIAGLTEYWGSHVGFTDLTMSNVTAQGWPFFEAWPYPNQPPANGTGKEGTPLLVHSGREYSLDLHVRRQKALMIGDARVQGGEPTHNLLLSTFSFPHLSTYYSDLEQGGGLAVLTPQGGSPTNAPLRANDLNNSGSAGFLFTSLGPGTYTLTLTHPRYTFLERGTANPSVTVTLPPWAAPGVLPPSDPGLSGYVEPLHIKRVGGFPTFDATHTDPGTRITLDIRFWDSVDQTYRDHPLSGLVPPGSGFLRPAYTGAKLFTGEGAAWPQGAFSAWIYAAGAENQDYYRANISVSGQDTTFDVYLGGPSANTEPAPAPSYELVLDSVSQDDPGTHVPGTTFTFQLQGGGSQVVPANGQTLPDFTGALGTANITNPKWVNAGRERILLDPAVPRVKLVALMDRGVKVRGVVRRAGGNVPVAGAQVRMLNRFGNLPPNFEQLSGTNGAFAFAALIPGSAPLFVEVHAPGYTPWRERFAPGSFIEDPLEPDLLLLDAQVELSPLPPPVMDELALDRQGGFLTGVSRAGNQSVFDRFQAEGPLTMTWTGRATAVPVTYTMALFDRPDGTSRGSQTYTIPDAIAEMFLVDPRAFTNQPYADPAVPVPPPATGGSSALHEWLREVQTGVAVNFASTTNVFHQRVNRLANGATAEQKLATGRIPLWQLPPEDFRPVLLARTKLGAVGLLNPHVAPAAPALKGLKTPAWMAFATDIMGSTAGIAATQDKVREWVPEGRFVPLPDFTAEIDADEDGFLNYEYGLTVEWATGNANPGTGLMAFAPGSLGLVFNGHAGFGLRGTNHEVFITNWANVNTESIPKRLLPPIPGLGKPNARLVVAATSGSSTQYDPVNDPYQFELSEAVSGGVDLSVEAGLNHQLGKLRYVGPVIKKLRPVDVTGLLEGGVELVSRTRWRTPFPPARPESSVGDLNDVYRRHFLGGDEERLDEYDICFRFGAGVRLEDSFGVLGATGKILLVGAPCNSGVPSMSLTVNPANDWPVITRIQAEAQATLDVVLNLWLTEVSQHWEWSLLTLEKQFGTDPVFTLAPLLVNTTLSSPSTAPPATFHTNGTVRLANLFSGGTFSARGGGSGDAFLFTDVNPGTGEMLLKLSVKSGGAWGSPVTVGGSGGILTADLATLPDGRRLVVWSQIAADDIGQPFPASTIFSSIGSPAGTGWSPPVTVANLTDVASELRLLANDSFTGLAWLCTADGPRAERYTLEAAVWNGAAWSAPTTLATDADIVGLAAAANSGDQIPAALIAVTRASGEVAVQVWNGAGFDPAVTLTNAAGDRLAVTATAAGDFYVAVEGADRGIQLWKRDGANWVNLGDLAPDARPAEIALASLDEGGATRLLVAWVEGGDVTRIHHVFADLAGAVLKGPEALTVNSTGTYHDIQLVPGAGGEGVLFTRRTDGSVHVEQWAVVFHEVRLANPRFGMGGRFEFDFIGSPGRSYQIQVSTNLQHWLSLTNLPGATAPVLFSDPASTGQPTRMYRAVSEP